MCARARGRGIQDVLIVEGAPPARSAARGGMRRADGPCRSGRGDVARLDGADLRGAPDPLLDGGSCPTGTARKVAAALKPVYTASSADAAEAALDRVRGQSAGDPLPRHGGGVGAGVGAVHAVPGPPSGPAAGHLLSHARGRCPLDELDRARTSYQLRKVTKNRGHFPCDAAAVKLLWPAGLQHRGQASR